ncbi:hypothetical protein L1987_20300 [Smallanthus sonchifolius]|uniref:Uncharacterized protein n=1 Tax=Smallanthus sonchifolius TaxID=185202 RepID=A0ACB9IT41_9ASTR|nr:hypothetical protein L1987_20300 [Smallanthus sonchifolius]
MFNISSLPTSLGYWLVSNYDPSCNQLNLGTHVITITPQTIHEVLGIPMGKVQFRKLKNPTIRDAVIAEFKNQFDIADKPPTPKNLFDHLKECKDAGRQFQLNFLVLFITIMGEITQGSTVNMKFLPRLTTGVDIKSFDWCTLISCLNKTTSKWNGVQHFSGPLTFLTERYKRTNPGKKQIPAISFFENDTINKLSAEDEEKEKEVKTETVKGDRNRKREGYVKYKSEEIFDAIDEWRFRLKHYGEKYNKELNEDKSAHAEKWENEEKRTQSQKMMKVEGQNNNESAEIVDDVIKNVCKDISKHHTNEVVTNETAQGEGGEDGEKKEEKGNEKKPAQEEKTEKAQRVIQKVADPVIAKPKQMETPGSSKKSGSRFDFARVTVGKDEKLAKGKGREGNEEKRAKVKKVKEVDAGEGNVNEQKVVEDDAGKIAQTGGKDDSEVRVNVKKVNEDDNWKTTQDGEVKKEKQHKVNVKKVKEVDAGEGKVDEQKVVGEDDAGVNLNKKNKEQKKNAARATRPAEALCSLYVQRVVQLNTKRENTEDIIVE